MEFSCSFDPYCFNFKHRLIIEDMGEIQVNLISDNKGGYLVTTS
jgi:hypothetical protein